MEFESPSSPTPRGVRRAGPDDIEGLARLWALAFPGERTVAERATELEHGGPWGGIEDCWLAEREGRIDGAFRALPLAMRVYGREIPTLGVAAVAVAPHARRRGLGATLCRAALDVGRMRGDLLSALYPFRTDFYARLGFALAGEFHRYRFSPSALVAPGAGGRRGGERPTEGGFGEDRITRIDDPLAEIPALYEQLLSRGHGLLRRSDKRWRVLFHEAPLAFGIRSRTGEGRWSGYLLASIRDLPRGEGLELRITELLATDADAYGAVFAWLRAQRDAWWRIRYDALPDERFERLLTHARLPGTTPARRLWFPSATILRGPMVRALDVGGLLRALDAEPGTRIAVEDPEIPENTGSWRVSLDGKVSRDAFASGGEAALSSDGVPANVAGSIAGGDAPSLSVGAFSFRLVDGTLPGLTLPRAGFTPLVGGPGFRVLDPF